MAFVLFICLYMLYVMLFVRPENLIAACIHDIRSKILDQEGAS